MYKVCSYTRGGECLSSYPLTGGSYPDAKAQALRCAVRYPGGRIVIERTYARTTFASRHVIWADVS